MLVGKRMFGLLDGSDPSGGGEARLEHFWLCGPCSSAFEFVFESDGSVSLKHRHDGQTAMTAA
jgi:hypothetical protein